MKIRINDRWKSQKPQAQTRRLGDPAATRRGRSLFAVDSIGGDFDLGNAAEGEQELNEVLGWLFRGLFHDVGNSVGDRGLEHDAFGRKASKVHTHELAGLEYQAHTKILPPRAVKRKPLPMIPNRAAAHGVCITR